ncbi:MAG: hypothetical protein AAFQ43_05235 [Bacteroidota bacterium]
MRSPDDLIALALRVARPQATALRARALVGPLGELLQAPPSARAAAEGWAAMAGLLLDGLRDLPGAARATRELADRVGDLPVEQVDFAESLCGGWLEEDPPEVGLVAEVASALEARWEPGVRATGAELMAEVHLLQGDLAGRSDEARSHYEAARAAALRGLAAEPSDDLSEAYALACADLADHDGNGAAAREAARVLDALVDADAEEAARRWTNAGLAWATVAAGTQRTAQVKPW